MNELSRSPFLAGLAVIAVGATAVISQARGQGGDDWVTEYSGRTPLRVFERDPASRVVQIRYETLVSANPNRRAPRTVRDRLDAIVLKESANSVLIGLEQTIQVRGEPGFVGATVIVPVRLKKPLGTRRVRLLPGIPELGFLTPRGDGLLNVEVPGPGPGASGPEIWRR